LISELTGVDSSYCIPDVVWDRIITLLSSSIRRRRKKKTIGDIDPKFDDCSRNSKLYNVMYVAMQGKNLGDLMNAKDVT
jgi:hypothetical protein